MTISGKMGVLEAGQGAPCDYFVIVLYAGKGELRDYFKTDGHFES